MKDIQRTATTQAQAPAVESQAIGAEGQWRWVPIEPTIEMDIAGSDAGNGHDWTGSREVYRAMLSAAPDRAADRSARAVPDAVGGDMEIGILVDGDWVAGASGPGALREARHYAAMYSEDGKVTAELITRRPFDLESGLAAAPVTSQAEPMARRLSQILGVVRTAQAQAARVLAADEDAGDLAQTRRDLPLTLDVIRHAVQSLAATPASPQAPAPQAGTVAEDWSKGSITLTALQLRHALDFASPDFDTDEDQRETAVSIAWAPAGATHTDEGDPDPAGYKVWMTDYPEEGSIPLDESPAGFPIKAVVSKEFSAVPLIQSLQSWKDIEVVSRIMRRAGKTLKQARNPGVTARDSIILANYIVELQGVIQTLMTSIAPVPAAPEPVLASLVADASRWRCLRTWEHQASIFDNEGTTLTFRLDGIDGDGFEDDEPKWLDSVIDAAIASAPVPAAGEPKGEM